MKMRKLSSSGLEVGSMLKSKDEAAASHLSQPTNVTLESEQKNGAIPNGFSGQHNPSPTAASIALDPSAPLLYAKPALQLGENAEVVGSRNSESANADATETNIPDALDDESHASESSEDGGAQLPTASPMSKNQMKKLRKKEEWDAGREYRKKKRKQKIAEKRLRKRAAKEEAMKAKAEAPKDDGEYKILHIQLTLADACCLLQMPKESRKLLAAFVMLSFRLRLFSTAALTIS